MNDKENQELRDFAKDIEEPLTWNCDCCEEVQTSYTASVGKYAKGSYCSQLCSEVADEYCQGFKNNKQEESEKFHTKEVTEKQDTISIVDDNGKVLEFSCEMETHLLKAFDNKISGFFIREEYNKKNKVFARWNYDGILLNVDDFGYSRHFNLTPIVNPWYENEDNFPALVVDLKSGAFYKVIQLEKCFIISDDGFRFKPEALRLATKEEKISLYCEEG